MRVAGLVIYAFRIIIDRASACRGDCDVTLLRGHHASKSRGLGLEYIIRLPVYADEVILLLPTVRRR